MPASASTGSLIEEGEAVLRQPGPLGKRVAQLDPDACLRARQGLVEQLHHGVEDVDGGLREQREQARVTPVRLVPHEGLPGQPSPDLGQVATPFGRQPRSAQWGQGDAPYSVQSTAKQPLSWMSLLASISQYAGPGIQLASQDVHRRRQIMAALKTLEGMALVRADPKPGRFTAGLQLLCENGTSTISSAISYTMSDDTEMYVETPVEFFTRGWVHVLTNSEIAALLMWFDRLKYNGVVVGAEEGDPVTVTYVTGDVRQGLYGLGREAYETHQALDAYQLLDVIRPEKRYDSGKWEGYSKDDSDLLCHRVSLAPAGFDRDAGAIVEDVLKRRDTGGFWRRPMFSTPKRFDRFRMVSGDD